MQAYRGSRSIASLILNRGAIGMWVVYSCSQPLYPNSQVHLDITFPPIPSSSKWSPTFTNIFYVFVASLKHAIYPTHHILRDVSL